MCNLDESPSSKPDELDEFIDDTKARQRNIVFPDMVRNGRSVDAFFWRGSPNPTLVQRIAAWLFGLVFVTMGLVWSSGTVSIYRRHDTEGIWITTAVGFACFLLGTRIFRNGFPRK